MALLLRQVGRQLAPLPAQVGGNSSSLQQLQARFDMVEPRADKSNAQLQEILQKVASGDVASAKFPMAL